MKTLLSSLSFIYKTQELAGEVGFAILETQEAVGDTTTSAFDDIYNDI